MSLRKHSVQSSLKSHILWETLSVSKYIPPTAPPTASPAGPRINAQILAILPVIRPPFRDCLSQQIKITDKVFLMGPKLIKTDFSPNLQI